MYAYVAQSSRRYVRVLVAEGAAPSFRCFHHMSLDIFSEDLVELGSSMVL